MEEVFILTLNDIDENGDFKSQHFNQFPVLLFIKSDGCGICRNVEPAFFNFAKNHYWKTLEKKNKINDIVFSIILPIDNNPDIGKILQRLQKKIPNVLGVPYYALFKNGRFISNTPSGRTEKDLENFIRI